MMRSEPHSAPLLRIRNVAKSFGAPVLCGVDLVVPEGKIIALLGANGAGKSTLFNVVCGFLRPDSGSVFLEDVELTGLPAYVIARRGLARLFQDVRLFGGLSVLENVLVGESTSDELPGALLLRPRLLLAGERRRRKRALELLDYVGLDVDPGRAGVDLSYGQQKRVAIARALMQNPRLLVLDEPSAGLDPIAIEALLGLLHGLRSDGITIWVIEHNRKVVEALATRVAFLAEGRIVADGPTTEIMEDERLAALYLGQ